MNIVDRIEKSDLYNDVPMTMKEFFSNECNEFASNGLQGKEATDVLHLLVSLIGMDNVAVDTRGDGIADTIYCDLSSCHPDDVISVFMAVGAYRPDEQNVSDRIVRFWWD